MTEMDATYIFIRYISVTVKRHAQTFYYKYNKTFYYENKEFVENTDMESKEVHSKLLNSIYENIDDRLFRQELLINGLNSLNIMEKQIIREKYFFQKSDAEIGIVFSVSGQMISKRKRNILNKLKSFL